MKYWLDLISHDSGISDPQELYGIKRSGHHLVSILFFLALTNLVVSDKHRRQS